MKVLAWDKLLGNSPQIKKKGWTYFGRIRLQKMIFSTMSLHHNWSHKGYRCEFIKKIAKLGQFYIKKNLSISSFGFDSLATFDCVGARAADI